MDSANIQNQTNQKIILLGWPSYVFLFFAAYIVNSVSSTGMVILTLVVGYIGGLIGNGIRMYGSPLIYTSDGTAWGGFKSRFYWRYGPQISGSSSAVILLYFFFIYSSGVPQP